LKLLILGGCGFIGSHIAEAMRNRGHQIRIFGHIGQHHQPLADVEYRQGDFADREAVDSALADIDVVIHAISTTNPGSSNKNPAADIQGNLISTVQLLELMRLRGIHRIVYLSSGGTVYGNPDRCPVAEDASVHPICSYGVVKVAVENYLEMYRQIHGFEPIILRPSNPYGPGQGHYDVQGVITSFLNRIRNGQGLQIWGDGAQVRDYIRVEDVAGLCVLAAEVPVLGTFNVGSGVGYSILDVIAIITEVTETQPEIEYHASRPFDVKRVVLDIEKAKQVFGWRPQIDLRQGIRDYWEWLRE